MNADPSLQLGYDKWYDSSDNFFWGRPDIYSESLRMVWDVKPDSMYGHTSGAVQIGIYTATVSMLRAVERRYSVHAIP